jgi:CheY-like chemotaxis protein
MRCLPGPSKRSRLKIARFRRRKMKSRTQPFPASPAVMSQTPDTFRGPTFVAEQAAPSARSQDLPERNDVHSVEPSADRGSIYAVDDNEDLTVLYTMLLEARGYTVRVFNDRGEALAALEKDTENPTLLITDCLGHSLPVDRFMRSSLAAHPNLRILMASGLNPRHVRLSCTRPDRFLQKPFTAEEFLKEVRNVLTAR